MHRYSIPMFFGTDDDVLVEVCHAFNLNCVPLLLYPPPSPYQAVSPQAGLQSMDQLGQEIICKSVFVRYTLKVLHHDILEVPQIYEHLYKLEMRSRLP